VLCFDEDSGLLLGTEDEPFFAEGYQPSKRVSATAGQHGRPAVDLSLLNGSETLKFF
jgi:hypothetical protein